MAKSSSIRGEVSRMTVSRDYAVVLEPSSAGGFVVTVPALPEVGTQGETAEQALEMAKDAIVLALSVRREAGEQIPPNDAPRLERVNVQIEAA